MDRYAVFVDAGYLLAEGGSVCLGTKERRQIRCNYPGLISALETLAQEHCRLPGLRTYWYDGAKDRIATPEHQTITNLPRVKIRLGRLTAHGQKGVDALIYHDIMTLARERAIAVAYLVAGDEDLREGVAVAEQMGVMVNLLGIRTGEQNQSLMLIAEADEHLWIPVEVLRRNLSRPSVPAQTATPATAVVAGASATRGSGTAVRAVPDPKPADDTGRRLAAQWLNAAAPSDRVRLRDALERGSSSLLTSIDGYCFKARGRLVPYGTSRSFAYDSGMPSVPTPRRDFAPRITDIGVALIAKTCHGSPNTPQDIRTSNR